MSLDSDTNKLRNAFSGPFLVFSACRTDTQTVPDHFFHYGDGLEVYPYCKCYTHCNVSTICPFVSRLFSYPSPSSDKNKMSFFAHFEACTKRLLSSSKKITCQFCPFESCLKRKSDIFVRRKLSESKSIGLVIC